MEIIDTNGIMTGKVDGDLFVSFFFIIFFLFTLTLYYLLPGRCRIVFLCLASWLYCACVDSRSFFILLCTTGYSYLAGHILERAGEHHRKRKIMAFCMIGLCVVVMVIFKYGTYLSTRLGVVLPETVLQQMIMPIGLSFYLFQVIAYLVDVYRKEVHAEKNFWHFSLWLTYFPKLISGPIEREKDFLPQLEKLRTIRFWHTGRFSVSVSYVLWGYFLKMVLADRMKPMVDCIFQNSNNFDSFFLLLGALLYTCQIYCDFAGYSYIAVGISEFFGIRLTMNFKEPYLAQSMTEFWRRWHISLSSWLRDYLYIPLGGNRKGTVRKIINQMVVFLVCGMWHGAGMNYLVWGLLHGGFTSIEALCRTHKKKGVDSQRGIAVRVTKSVGVFCLAAFAWIFFRAESASGAIRYLQGIFSMNIWWECWRESFTAVFGAIIEVWIVVLGLIAVLGCDVWAIRKGFSFPTLLQQKNSTIRYTFFVVMIFILFVFGIYGPGYDSGQFIYMQF